MYLLFSTQKWMSHLFRTLAPLLFPALLLLQPPAAKPGCKHRQKANGLRKDWQLLSFTSGCSTVGLQIVLFWGEVREHQPPFPELPESHMGSPNGASRTNKHVDVLWSPSINRKRGYEGPCFCWEVIFCHMKMCCFVCIPVPRSKERGPHPHPAFAPFATSSSPPSAALRTSHKPNSSKTHEILRQPKRPCSSPKGSGEKHTCPPRKNWEANYSERLFRLLCFAKVGHVPHKGTQSEWTGALPSLTKPGKKNTSMTLGSWASETNLQSDLRNSSLFTLKPFRL